MEAEAKVESKHGSQRNGEVDLLVPRRLDEVMEKAVYSLSSPSY